jgi:hypothetical protein
VAARGAFWRTLRPDDFHFNALQRSRLTFSQALPRMRGSAFFVRSGRLDSENAMMRAR